MITNQTTSTTMNNQYNIHYDFNCCFALLKLCD